MSITFGIRLLEEIGMGYEVVNFGLESSLTVGESDLHILTHYQVTSLA